MKKVLRNVSAVVALMVTFTACELTTTPEQLESDGDVIVENMDAQMKSVKVFENVNNFGFGSSDQKSGSILDEAPAATWDGQELTLNFSEVSDISGMIKVAFSGTPSYTEGLEAVITFVDYTDNNTSMEGTMKMWVKQVNFDQGKVTKVVFNIVTVGKLKFTDSGVSYEWECDQDLEWFEGTLTWEDNSDDSYILNGTTTQYMDTITNKLTMSGLLISATCDYVQSGTLELVQEERTTTCDFSVGKEETDVDLCDEYVQISSGGLTLKIKM